MITAVSIAGVPVDLGRVLATNLTVMHGRTAFDDGPAASSADLTLLWPASDGLPGWSGGDPLTITGEHGPLFTGTITDRRIPGHVDTLERGRCAQLELIAAGPLAAAGYRPVGDTPWPQEAGSSRAQRILAAAGLPALVKIPTAPEVQVLARDVDAQPALTLLEDLAGDTAAAVVDLPDGRILYQPLEARSRPLFNIRWMDIDPADTWDGLDPATTWADLDILSPASAVPLNIPPAAVEAEPQWVATAAAIVNHARIGYGLPPEGQDQATVDAVDQASDSRYGQRYAYLGTQIATQADALARADRIISTQAWERWGLTDITVWETMLDPQTAATLAQIVCGAWVQITALPLPAPATAWAGICEGWTYTEHHTPSSRQAWWTLALSDPLHSLAVFTWADYVPAYEWQQHPPDVLWADLTDTGVLTGE